MFQELGESRGKRKGTKAREKKLSAYSKWMTQSQVISHWIIFFSFYSLVVQGEIN